MDDLEDNLYLTFFYRDKLLMRLVQARAVGKAGGMYFDLRYIYTDQGNFERRKIVGVVEEQWKTEPKSQENKDNEARG